MTRVLVFNMGAHMLEAGQRYVTDGTGENVLAVRGFKVSHHVLDVLVGAWEYRNVRRPNCAGRLVAGWLLAGRGARVGDGNDVGGVDRMMSFER